MLQGKTICYRMIKIGHVMKYRLYLWYILFQTPEESWEKVLSFLWRLYILIYFFGIHMCISLLMTCLNQFLPASRNRGAEELKGKEKTNALLPKYVWLSVVNITKQFKEGDSMIAWKWHKNFLWKVISNEPHGLKIFTIIWGRICGTSQVHNNFIFNWLPCTLRSSFVGA